MPARDVPTYYIMDKGVGMAATGAGHWLQQEQPDRLNAFMIGFLRTHAKA
jgi:pimeloyl-ACP methyl ester carboxylesterase